MNVRNLSLLVVVAALLAALAETQSRTSVQAPQKALEEGDRLLRAGYPVLAIRQYRDAMRDGVPPAIGELRIAHAHCAAGDLANADKALARVLELDKANGEAQLLRGRVRFWQRRFDASWKWFRSYLDQVPKDNKARMDYALSLAWGRRFDDALVELNRLAKTSEYRLEALFRRAEVLAWQKRYADSRALLKKVLAERKVQLALQARCHVLRGQMLAWEKQFVRAEGSYLEAVRIHPHLEVAWMALGEVYEWQGKTARARAAYARALQVAPLSRKAKRALERMNHR